uniref:Reverse transcriptase domain-containing protein n=1 Tax=Strongyloides venezuelensis TaxID=75913 RepID=A0A0K0FYZ8_STRVS
MIINIETCAFKGPISSPFYCFFLQGYQTIFFVLSSLSESVGRLVGRSFKEAFAKISKWAKSAENMVMDEILDMITKIVLGLENTSTSTHKSTYKSLLNPYLTDRVLFAIIVDVNCLHALV